VLTHDVARPSAIARLGGVATIGAAIFSVVVHVWLVNGTFVPIRVDTIVEYAWVSASARSFAAIACIVSAAIAASHALVRRFAARQHPQPPLLTWADVGYLRPLWCFAATLLPLFDLLRPRVQSLAVLSYAIVDMRWWWGAAVALWLVRNVDARLNAGWRSRLARVDLSRGLGRWLPELSIAVITIASPAIARSRAHQAGHRRVVVDILGVLGLNPGGFLEIGNRLLVDVERPVGDLDRLTATGRGGGISMRR